jgi:cell division protein FtsI (penicillin-binding protein 3)
VAEQPAFHWRPIFGKRIAVMAVVFALWTLGIIARLVFLQVVSHQDMVMRADRQQMRTVTAPAKRGEISDRHGRLLAYSVDADTIYAVPSEIGDSRAAAARLCGALSDCSRKERAALEERLSQRKAFVYVKRRATPVEARRVAGLELDGIGFMKESKRFYPNRELGAHLLGYVGLDNVGLHGVEAAYDKVVRGKEGTLLVQTDARRKAFSRLERPPTAGGSLELTIDEQLQYIAERELRAGVAENRAAGGTAVVMDPHTGEVLAMASWPTYNPNEYGETAEVNRRNRAIQDLYEPGSTFKIVTASAAIEERLFNTSEMIDVSAGQIRFGARVIRDMHRYAPLSFTDVLVKSSNVGAIKIGGRVGAERMGMYIRRFGFGRPTSRDFQGESPGIVWDSAQLNDSALASVSMGYQIGVTALQMVSAVSAVANGGTLYEPRLVRAISKDGVRTLITPNEIRQAIKPETAATLTTIMEQVVDRGTATRAKLAGFTVAGKTGTADKLVNGRYSVTQQNVSFVGFAPSRNPVIAVIVMVDSPSAGPDTGGIVSAPIFQRIAEDSLRYLGVASTVNPAPPIIVERRQPSPVRPVVAEQSNTLIVPMVAGGGSNPSVLPDLRGLSARDAMRSLAQLGLRPRLRGVGMVIDQSPAPGEPLEPGTVCTLMLDRDPRLAVISGALP